MTHYFEEDLTQRDPEGNFKLKCRQCKMHLDQLGNIYVSRCRNAPSLSESVSRVLKIMEDMEKREKEEKDRQRIEGNAMELHCFLFY
jgi:hypothetical protein